LLSAFDIAAVVAAAGSMLLPVTLLVATAIPVTRLVIISRFASRSAWVSPGFVSANRFVSKLELAAPIAALPQF